MLGDFEVAVPAMSTLDRELDVLWVTPKATQLEAALELIPGRSARGGCVVVPLLNGLDHVGVLRERFGERVLAASIAIESERVDVGRFRQKSAFAEVALAPGARAAQICAELTDAGLGCRVGASEAEVLWQKLAVLTPIALTTTALEAPLSAVVADPDWRPRLDGCVREVAAVAGAEGVEFDADAAMSRYEQIGDLQVRCRRIARPGGRSSSTRSAGLCSARPGDTASTLPLRRTSSIGLHGIPDVRRRCERVGGCLFASGRRFRCHSRAVHSGSPPWWPSWLSSCSP